MKLIKLTNKKNRTCNNYQWGASVTNYLPRKNNPRLCSGDVLHAYRSINLALLLNPIHANLKDFNIW